MDNIYSCYHYHKKCEESANNASISASNAEEAKNLANEAVSRLGEFDSTVDNAKLEITELSESEQAIITSTAINAKEGAVIEINTTAETAIDNIEQAGTVIANYQQPIVNITETNGTISLESTKIYQMSVTGATTFALPVVSNTSTFHQIKVMMSVTGTPTIDWGTTNFFNKATPEIEEGNYDVYFDYDNLLGAWVCGVMAKGAAE